MSFLKLGDLIEGGHPVSVGDDGTVFTRLNIDHLGVPADEATTSSQEIGVDDLPIDFLSDPSIVSLANNVELTVINFEDFQRDEIQDTLSSVTPNSGYNAADNTISFLGLNDYQLDCTSDELLESCLKSDTSTIESNQDVAQYLNEDLFIPHLDDPIDGQAQDTEKLFPSESVLNTSNNNDNGSASAFGFCPNDSRVLFDIGNLSSGNVPEHHGFIKLTTDDSVPASNTCFDADSGETIELQAPANNLPIQSGDIDELESLVYLSTFSEISLKEKTTNYLDPDINITTEPDLINEFGQTTESDNTELTQKFSKADNEFDGSDCDITITLLQNGHQELLELITDDYIPASHECSDDDARETTNVQTSADDLPRQSDDREKSESIVSPSTFPQIGIEGKTTSHLVPETNVATEPNLIFDIGRATQLETTELSQKCNDTETEFRDSDFDETSALLHIELIKVETKDCDEREGKSERSIIKAKHKCLDSASDKTFLSEPTEKRHCSLVNGPIKPYVCTVNGCGLAFRFSSYLERHIRNKHDGVRDYECTECGHAFVTQRDLVVHTRKHTGDRSEPCPDPDCELMFFTRSNATTHFLVKHSTVKGFKCDECGKAFGTLSNLKEHGLTHVSVKDFVCLVIGCEKAFKTNGKLKRHSLLHVEGGSFQCNQCERTFRKSSSLDKHVKKKHSDRSNS